MKFPLRPWRRRGPGYGRGSLRHAMPRRAREVIGAKLWRAKAHARQVKPADATLPCGLTRRSTRERSGQTATNTPCRGWMGQGRPGHDTFCSARFKSPPPETRLRVMARVKPAHDTTLRRSPATASHLQRDDAQELARHDGRTTRFSCHGRPTGRAKGAPEDRLRPATSLPACGTAKPWMPTFVGTTRNLASFHRPIRSLLGVA